MRPNGLVTLLTDFGTADGYVGAMRGAALAAAADVRLVDLTHEIPRHDVRQAAFVLAFAAPAFPLGTTHCVVVDPGVGSGRRALLVAAGGHFFVGPDNGVLWPAVRALGGRTEPQVAVLTLPAGASTTFHGRDVFAPAAARVATGRCDFDGQPQAAGWTEFVMPRPVADGSGRWRGIVLSVDCFGNVITNFDRATFDDEVAPGTFRLRCGPVVTEVLRTCYAEGVADDVFCIWGSGGRLELSVCEGSAADRIRPERRGPWPAVELDFRPC